MAIIIFRTISSILYIGGLVMTGIGGWYDYQQTSIMPYGPFGFSILLWGIIIAGVGSILLIGQLWYKIRSLERPKTAIDITFRTKVGREISLIIHNKGNIPATFSADMTCCIIPGARQLTKIFQLINASMIWESSGTDTETINAGRSKVLKVCYFTSEDRNGSKILNMNFYKRELSKSEIVPCADYAEGNIPTPKVQMNITFGANLPIRGKNNWKYEIAYALPAPLLYIMPI
jgi:hypothetical protein